VALRKAKLINNAAFVHLALRYENPFCDHPIILIPKEFALRWQIPESSVYEAIAKLKENHAITIRSGKITIEWANSDDSQQASDSENPEKFWNPRKNSENSEKRASKPAQGKNSKALQTIQTIQTFTDSLSETEREKFLEFGLKKASELPKPPALPEKWIERNFKELHVQFRKEVSEAILPSQEWEDWRETLLMQHQKLKARLNELKEQELHLAQKMKMPGTCDRTANDNREVAIRHSEIKNADPQKLVAAAHDYLGDDD